MPRPSPRSPTREPPAGWRHGLALAVHGAYETPPEVVERADGFLAAPHDAARVLSLIARTIDAEAG